MGQIVNLLDEDGEETDCPDCTASIVVWAGGDCWIHCWMSGFAPVTVH